MSESRIKVFSAISTIAAIGTSTLLAKYYLYDKKGENRDEPHESDFDEDRQLERRPKTSIVERVYKDVQKFNFWQSLGISIGLCYTGMLRREYFKNNCRPKHHTLVSVLDLAGGLTLGTLSFGVNAASWFDGEYNQTFGIAYLFFQMAFLPDNVYERFETVFTLFENGLPVKKQ